MTDERSYCGEGRSLGEGRLWDGAAACSAPSLSSETRQALRRLDDEHRRTMTVAHRPLIEPEQRERWADARSALLTTFGNKLGIELGPLLSEMRRIRAEKGTTITDAIKRRDRDLVAGLHPVDPVARPPQPAFDHAFYWADTYGYFPDGMFYDFGDAGADFRDGPQVHDRGGERRAAFGIVARFALQPQRLPASASGWFASRPFAELTGGMTLFAPDTDWLEPTTGHAACRLMLRQTVFQWGFGSSGPERRVVKEAIDIGPWLGPPDEADFSRDVPLPGTRDLPPLRFHGSQFVGHEELWSELEIRVEIELAGAGAVLYCSPQALIRTIQWPLEAVP